MKITKNDIIETYSKELQERCREYSEVMKIRKPGLGPITISKITGIDEGRIKHWVHHDVKPILIKVIEELECKGLLPFTEKNENFESIFDCFAFVFGDGHLSGTVVRLTGNKNDLSLLKKKLIDIGFKCKIYKRIVKNHMMPNGKMLNGKSYSLFVYSSVCIF